LISVFKLSNVKTALNRLELYTVIDHNIAVLVPDSCRAMVRYGNSIISADMIENIMISVFKLSNVKTALNRLEFSLCTLTPEVQCLPFHQNHMMLSASWKENDLSWYISVIRQTVRYRTPVFTQPFSWCLHVTITYNLPHLRLWYVDVVTIIV
jgi:hypothetical protein